MNYKDLSRLRELSGIKEADRSDVTHAQLVPHIKNVKAAMIRHAQEDPSEANEFIEHLDDMMTVGDVEVVDMTQPDWMDTEARDSLISYFKVSISQDPTLYNMLFPGEDIKWDQGEYKDMFESPDNAPIEEAKPVYYKQPIMSLEQLKKNCVRISTDIRMGGSTKAEHIERMFSEYEQAMAGATQQPTPEAVGEFAEPIYALCDELECPDNHPVFDDLVRYMSGDQINDFVDDFRRNHDMPAGGTDEGIAATIGQGIDSAVAGAGKMAVKGLKKGVKKLSRLGSKNTSTSFDGKGGSKTTTTYNEQDNESN